MIDVLSASDIAAEFIEDGLSTFVKQKEGRVQDITVVFYNKPYEKQVDVITGTASNYGYDVEEFEFPISEDFQHEYGSDKGYGYRVHATR